MPYKYSVNLRIYGVDGGGVEHVRGGGIEYTGTISVQGSMSPAKETAFKAEMEKAGFKLIWKDGVIQL